MKVIFSVYREDFETWEDEFLFSRIVVTNASLPEIDTILNLHQGFRSTLEAGEHLVFWDIYCISVDPSAVLKLIEEIPTTDIAAEATRKHEAKILIFESYDPCDIYYPIYPDMEKCYIYRLNRYECGASSMEALVVWASSHPWLMVFIGGFLWDAAKYLVSQILSKLSFLLFRERRYFKSRRKIRMVYFSPKLFYKYFSQATNVASDDCQIIYLKKIGTHTFSVLVKTLSRDYYLVECNRKGKIMSLELVDDSTSNELLHLWK